MILLACLAAVALLAGGPEKRAAQARQETAGTGSERTPKGSLATGRWLLGAVTVAVLLFVAFRFRAHWLAIGAAGAFALLRRTLPWLLRLGPGLVRFFARRSRADGSGGGAPRSDAGGSGGATRGHGRMTREEALAVLGIKEGATREEVTAAYRSLMKRIHPDRGGSAYLAAKLNEARDLLLS